MGSLWQVLVMFGMGLCTNYDVKLNTRWRYDGTNVITSVIAQGGAALAVFS